MSDLVKLSTQDTVGIITIDNPPVNVLRSDVCEHIERCLDAVAFNPALESTILIGAGRTFVAGADINELANASESGQTLVPKLGHLLGKLETLNKPAVAALHGSALGGGLDLEQTHDVRGDNPCGDSAVSPCNARSSGRVRTG